MMVTLLYIPLDERPCNYLYPQQIAHLQDNLTLLVPPKNVLGRKKHPANINHLWDWIGSHIGDCQAAILSIEMLVYGGLLPSRLHDHSLEELGDRLHRIRHLKVNHSHLNIFASSLIMRTPAYNSSEEEPDYYADWGRAIFQWGWFDDKRQRQGLTDVEASEFEQISHVLPLDYLEDYRTRRRKNVVVNQNAIALVKDNIVDFLAIPQDDSAPYGFTALDQKQVVSQIIDSRLQHHIHFYPGADEVGCTLLARAYLSTHWHDASPVSPLPKGELRGVKSLIPKPTIYPFYSSVCSKQIVPLYEDRPLGESLKSHILAAGAQIASTPDKANIILAVNTPGTVMQESWDQESKDITYTTYRNLRFFVDQIGQYVQSGRAVAIADVAFANGGETELVQLLDDAQLWDEIVAYGGWNTCCNTFGSTLATALVGLHSTNLQAIQFNKVYHLLEDWAYQAVVRMEMVHTYLPTLGASYYDFNGQETAINQHTEQRLRQVWADIMHHSFHHCVLETVNVFSPWDRMFEIGIDLTLSYR